MNKKVVLITGGCGFIGTNLVKKLLISKFVVHNADKISYCSTPVNLSGIKKNKYFFFHKIDLCNEKKTNSLIKKIKPNFIINLAAESHVDRSIDSPKKFFINNVSSTLNLLEAVRNNVKNFKITKIIHISTDEVYGGEIKSSSKEEDKYITSSPYSASKAGTDHLCNSYRTTYKLPIIILNCCNNFGPYQFPEKFIPTILNSINKKDKIPIYGNGKNIREWIYVEDFCEAIKLALQKKLIGNKYNIGSNIRISNLDLVKRIIRIFNKNYRKIKKQKKLIRYVSDRPGHDFKYSINSNKFRKELKWKPKYNMTEGIKNTIRWYLKNRKWLSYCYKKYKGQRLGKI